MKYKLGFSFSLAAAFLALIGVALSFSQDAEFAKNLSGTFLSETVYHFHARCFVSVAVTCTVAGGLAAINKWWVQILSVGVLGLTMYSLYMLARSFFPMMPDADAATWFVRLIAFGCVACVGTAFLYLVVIIIRRFGHEPLR